MAGWGWVRRIAVLIYESAHHLEMSASDFGNTSIHRLPSGYVSSQTFAFTRSPKFCIVPVLCVGVPYVWYLRSPVFLRLTPFGCNFEHLSAHSTGKRIERRSA